MSRTAHHGTRRERTENHRPAVDRHVYVAEAHSFDTADARVAAVVAKLDARLARREAA